MKKEKVVKTNDKEIKINKKCMNKEYHATKEITRKHEIDGMCLVEKGTNKILIKLMKEEVDQHK